MITFDEPTPKNGSDDHFNKISLDERVKKIEDLLRKLDEGMLSKKYCTLARNYYPLTLELLLM